MLMPVEAGLRWPVLTIVTVCGPLPSTGLVHTTPDAVRVAA
ncbi:hypothetical protein ACFPIJ_00145 [Dactylosporangium cerinum]|uniref:Uncharacterized protein n=1 Tax=Dactylosporangium cerinum TaxID=1434730 RepID=A0ABV9VMK9_9ACTN